MVENLAVWLQFANFAPDFLVNLSSHPRVGWECADQKTMVSTKRPALG